VKTLLSGSARMLVTTWRIDRRKTAVAVIMMMAGAIAAPLVADALRWMTDAVVARDATSAAVDGIVVAALVIVALTFAHFAHIAYFELSELAELDFDRQLIALSNGSPGIEHHEIPEQADTLTLLQQETRRFRHGLEALLNLLSLALAIILTGVLLATVSPLLLLLPVAAVPPLIAGRLAEKTLDRAHNQTAEQTRVALNLFHLTTSARAAGELRVFRLRDVLVGRHAELWQSATRVLWRARLRGAWIRAAGQFVFAVVYVGAVLLVVYDAVRGHRSVGDVVLVVALAAQVNQQVTTAVTLSQHLQRMASAYRLLGQMDSQVRVATDRPADQRPPERLGAGIMLEGVGFSYPQADAAPALRDVNLTLPAGSTVAIVGENGAGKTTLVKLLCGFYRPTTGRILVDGIDLVAMPPDDWRQRIAAGFQDFVRYEFSAQYAVGVGDLPRAGSESAVRAALDRANAGSVIDQLADGLDTQLGKSYADGAELSGGQWQKLALGRALMRQAPLLLVLDEPASALDPEAEHALFERYSEQARRVREATGAVTLFVSHRFSTVRTADVIVVVDNGRVVEVGDHAALLAANGLYAELFNIQAAAYR
jgi:ATP-binding cassette, subfamily B, bacterial